MSQSSDDSLISNSLSSQSTDSDYIPSQTPETEDYTSYESEAGQSLSDTSDNSLISNSLSSQSTDSDYIPSQTPETEDYTSYESEAGQSLSSETLSEAGNEVGQSLQSLTPAESEYSTDSGSYDYSSLE